jgi:tetratricopeptide (TPR) repeat protein
VGDGNPEWIRVMAKETAPDSARSTPATPPLWPVPVFLVGLAAVLVMGFFRPFRDDTGFRKLDRDLESIRNTLAERRPNLEELAQRAEDVLARSEIFARRTGEAHFLLGTIHLRRAGSAAAPQAVEIWQKARFHFQEAEQLGVPQEDQPKLSERLGLTLHQTGAEPQRVLDYLRRFPEAADDLGAYYTALTQTYLRLPVPDVRAALNANQKLLALPTADDAILAPARLLRGELLLQVKESVEARKVLERIGQSAPPAIRSRARLLAARSYLEEGAWEKAAELWHQILADNPGSPQESGRIWYALGLCYRQTERPADADHAWETALKGGGEVAQAAALRLAELRLEGVKRGTSLELYERALRDVQQPADWRNPLLDIAEARPLVEAGCRVFREIGDPAAAVRLGSFFIRIAVPPSGHLALAEALEAWATDLGRAGDREQPRVRFREAATLFESVAEARLGQQDYAEWLWRAGRCWALGEESARTVPVLERFVKLLAAPERLGEAWYRLGEAHQRLGNAAAAETAWKQCILYPSSFAFQAPIRLASVQAARGNVDEAIEILEQNLRRMDHASGSEAHEQSLFTLGGLYFQSGKFDQAAEHYQRALERYPANPGALTAAYHLAECYRRRAMLDYENIGNSSLPLAQQHYQGKYRLHLEQAAANYRKVVANLAGREGEGRLTPAEASMLLRSRFAVADCESSLGHLDKAAPLYDALARQYAGHVEALIALKQLERCYSMQGRIDQARATLVLFSKALSELPDAAFQGRPEQESRLEFRKWLDRNTDLLNQLAPAAAPQS